MHEATWQPTADFIDRDGTVTKALLEYVSEHQLTVPSLSRSTTGGGENSETVLPQPQSKHRHDQSKILELR